MSTNAAAACEVLATYNWASGEAGYREDWFLPFPLEPQAEFEVDPGSHTYEIRYKRRADGGDEAHWLLDSEPQATFGELGIPLDAPARHDRRAIGAYPSRGSGEPLAGKLTSFSVARELFSLVGEFPFTEISIPATERIFGQGIEASFGPVSVERSAA